MPNMLDDEFMVANYMSGNNSRQHMDASMSAVEQALQWSADAMRTIIIPTDNLYDLDTQWIKFNEMIKKNRRESDWKSLELFGMTNQQHYEYLRHKLLDKNIKDKIDNYINPPVQEDDEPIISESYIDLDPADSYYNPDIIRYGTDAVEKARKWAEESNRTIIIPTRTIDELESLWDGYNMMIKKHRRESDWMSLDLFGVTNLKHYEFLKSQFLRDDIQKSKDYEFAIESMTTHDISRYFKSVALNESVSDLSKSLLEAATCNNSMTDDMIIGNVITDIVDDYGDTISSSPTVDIPYGDMPFFDPNEMIDMGVFGQSDPENFFGAVADNSMINDTVSVKEWFDMYQAMSDGFYTEFAQYTSDWIHKLRELTYGLKAIEKSGDEKSINARKQSILELGWNPAIEFSNQARLLAREMAQDRMSKLNHMTKIIDLTGFRTDDYQNMSFNEDNTTVPQLFPVFVIVTEGKSIISPIIKKVTKSKYSHASISFDPLLREMYSYGINGSINGMKGGFVIENISEMDVGVSVGVYVFFVSKNIYDRLQNEIQKFKDNIQNCFYSYKNLFTYIFNIPYNTDWNMVCSQFVDRILKSVDIDITHKDPSLVAPSTIRKSLNDSNRIYNVYKGLASKYDGVKVSKLIESLRKRIKPLKENRSYYNDQPRYINDIINNIENIPVLLELQSFSYVVKNKNIKSILENILFDSINIQAYGEAKTFPIQFDKEGNLLIHKKGKLDYASEYAKSHKLLKEYKKSNNIEGMKYEVSKLWMMLCMIEEALNSKKFRDLPSFAIASSAEVKNKANINNDFQYYIKEIMKADPTFNFTEYYNKSPFSSASTKVNASTIRFVGKLIKNFIKPF